MTKHYSKYFKASLAVATSGLAASASSAAVVKTTYDTVLNYSDGGEVAFDINEDEVDDYQFAYAGNNSQKLQITSTSFGSTEVVHNQICLPAADADHSTLSVLSAGEVVGPDLYGGVTLDEGFFFQNWNQNYWGDWGGTGGAAQPDPIQGPVAGYVGLAIPTDETLTSFNYGYARFETDFRDALGDPPGGTIILRDTAFETQVDTPITIAAPPPRVTLEINMTTGAVEMQNLLATGANLDYYRISSASGSLRAGNAYWSSLDDQDIDSGGGAPVGDYNSDGTVNAADYTVWRDTLNSTTDLRADGNGDHVVNEADFGVWKGNFGATGGGSGGGVGWIESGGSGNYVLAETFIDSAGSTLAAGASYDLGHPFAIGGTDDLIFQYALDGQPYVGNVNYVSAAAGSLSAVPEPAAFTLFLGLGLTLAGALRVRTKST